MIVSDLFNCFFLFKENESSITDIIKNRFDDKLSYRMMNVYFCMFAYVCVSTYTVISFIFFS